MTPDVLHAKGYSIEVGAWGCRVIYEPEGYSEESFVVNFAGPIVWEEGCRRGWEAAEVDFVKRRLS